MRRAITLLVVVVLAFSAQPSPAAAAGWNDFSLEIAPGFVVFRANSDDVVLLGAQYNPRSARGVGPVVAYAVSDSLILVRHRGTRGEGASFFYRVERRDGATVGPLTEVGLLAREEVQPLRPVAWTPVEHPRPLVPLLIGTLMLGMVLGPLVLVPLGWLGLLLWFWRRRRRGVAAGPDLRRASKVSVGVAVWATLAVVLDAPFPLWLPALPANAVGLGLEAGVTPWLLAFFGVVAVAWIPYALLAVCLLRALRGGRRGGGSRAIGGVAGGAAAPAGR